MKAFDHSDSKRHIGIEIEYAGLNIAHATDIIKSLFGGEIHGVNDAVYKVENTSFGDFRIEVDAIALQKLAELSKTLKNDPSHYQKLDQLALDMIQMLQEGGSKIAPFEIVAPPIPIEKLPEMEHLREALREKGARDTRQSFYYAFGLHLNPEVTSLETDYILRHLQAFLLLWPWLKTLHRVDISRRITSFVDPFPASYLKLVLNKSYQPDLEQLIQDYHHHNPSRNRALDLLPLFAHLNEPLTRKLYGAEEKIHPRPTFHYRLPNCELSDPSWSFTLEWKRWQNVERLAGRETLLQELITKWQSHQEKWIALESDWEKQIAEAMESIHEAG